MKHHDKTKECGNMPIQKAIHWATKEGTTHLSPLVKDFYDNTIEEGIRRFDFSLLPELKDLGTTQLKSLINEAKRRGNWDDLIRISDYIELHKDRFTETDSLFRMIEGVAELFKKKGFFFDLFSSDHWTDWMI
jgi:hypothetical protein